MRFASLLLILCMGLSSGCSPKYFILPDIQEAVEKYDPVAQTDLDQAVSYIMTLKPRTFYKNNIEETVLLPDNSSFLQSGALLLLDSTDVSIPKWHAFHAWIQNCEHGPSCTKLHQGQRIALASVKGRTQHEKTELERVTIFYGVVDETSLAEVKALGSERSVHSRTNIRLDHEVLLIGNKSKVRTAKGSGRDPRLIAVVEKDKDHVSIFALVDKTQTNIGVEKSIIFDFQQIYGEPLWLVRQ